jgi:hypothetical protein
MRIKATPEGDIPFTEQEELDADTYATAWTSGQPRRDALARIAVLEASVTSRRMREAFTPSGALWLASIDDQIAALRLVN